MENMEYIKDKIDFLMADTARYIEEMELKYLELKLNHMQREMWAWFLKQGFDPNQPRAPRGTPIGGQWILDLNQVTEKYGWKDSEALKGHFERHGKQFNSRSPRDYAQRAKAFYDKALRNKLPMGAG
jgi:hypothetical protein